MTLNTTSAVASGDLVFYPGWALIHTDWAPVGYPYAELRVYGTASVAQYYFSYWTSPVLAFVTFGLFGVTSEALASYWRIICTVGGWFGWKPTPHGRNGRTSLGDIEFGRRPAQDTSGFDLEDGVSATSLVCSSSSDRFEQLSSIKLHQHGCAHHASGKWIYLYSGRKRHARVGDGFEVGRENEVRLGWT